MISRMWCPRLALPARPALGILLTAAVGSAACGLVTTTAPAAASASAPWTIQATPPATGKLADLATVSCPSATACIAAGSQGTTAVPKPLAERWRPSGWTIQVVPQPAGSASAALAGVSCASATACTAVGSYQASSGAQKILAEGWNGTTWAVQPTPDPAGDNPALDAVSCAAPGTCVAVGDYSTDAGVQKTLSEVWNGTRWAVQAIPSPAGDIAILTGVSCTSAVSCTAAGDYLTRAGAQKTLAEHWDGANWAIQPTPNPAGTSPTLTGVSCPTMASCTAAGDYLTPAGKQKTLAEHWNGTTWAIQPTAGPAGTFPALDAVSCPATHACTATGTYDTPTGWKTLAEHWDGTSWAIQPTPNPGGAVPTLEAVSCPSATTCTATGNYQASAHTGKALAERYQS
jgi:hypothetical protein